MIVATYRATLTNQQSRLVDRLVASGSYKNASEVLGEGLRLIERRETEYQTRLKALREAVQIGIADMDAGRFVSFDSPGEMRTYLSARMKKVIAGAAAQTRRDNRCL